MQQRYDYLYVDRTRIISYFEQLYLQFHAELKESGRGPLASTASFVSSSDLYRKAAFVLDCLKRGNHVVDSFAYDNLLQEFDCDHQRNAPLVLDNELYHNYPRSQYRLVPFVHARLQATKVLFPFTLDLSSDKLGIVVWLHWNRDTFDNQSDFSSLANLWMLENFSANDVAIRSPKACRYSALVGMIKECFCDFSKTILNKHQFVRDLESMSFVDFQVKHPAILSKFMFENSVEVAVQLGGEIARSSGEVEVLCRVRDHVSYAGMGTHVYAQAVFVRTTQE